MVISVPRDNGSSLLFFSICHRDFVCSRFLLEFGSSDELSENVSQLDRNLPHFHQNFHQNSPEKKSRLPSKFFKISEIRFPQNFSNFHQNISDFQRNFSDFQPNFSEFHLLKMIISHKDRITAIKNGFLLKKNHKYPYNP